MCIEPRPGSTRDTPVVSEIGYQPDSPVGSRTMGCMARRSCLTGRWRIYTEDAGEEYPEGPPFGSDLSAVDSGHVRFVVPGTESRGEAIQSVD